MQVKKVHASNVSRFRNGIRAWYLWGSSELALNMTCQSWEAVHYYYSQLRCNLLRCIVYLRYRLVDLR